jgi:hypothetical protein
VKAKLVTDLLTPCDAPTYLRAIRGGLETLSGRTPSNAHVAVLTAQSALESGRWKSMHRFNPGNIKASDTYGYLFCQFRCNEVIGGKVQWFEPPHPQTNFRAFLDLETGVLDYLRFLSQRARYSSSWHAAESGDPALFVHALKNAGYFTADEAPYRRAVQSLFNEYLRLMVETDRDTLPDPAEIDHEAAVAVVTPDAERAIHNTAVMNSYVDAAYDRIHNDPHVWNPPPGDE